MIDRVVSQLITILLLMIAGYALKKRNILDDGGARGLAAVLLRVTTPAMMIMAFQREYTKELDRQFLTITGAAAAVFLALALAGYLVTKALPMDGPLRGTFILGSFCSNVAFMGIPMISAVYGQEALIYSAGVIFGYNIVFFCLGPAVCHMGTDRKTSPGKAAISIVTNPVIIGGAIGYVIFRFSVALPSPVLSALDYLGSATVPISMMTVGIALAAVTLRDFLDRYLYAGIAMNLIISPVVGWLISRALFPEAMIVGVFVVSTAMPAAGLMPALAAEEGGDPGFASRLVFVSTILSVFTIQWILGLLL